MKRIGFCLLTFCLAIFARWVPLSFIIGSSHSFFSWTTIVAPVMAVQLGFWSIFSFLVPSKVIGMSLGFFLLHRLPIFFSAWVFKSREQLSSIIISSICIVLFVLHPVGKNAWPYALYWIIPSLLALVKYNAFVRAFQASFVAHAVGSVIWLYVGSITADVWLQLIPIVAYERILMALGMVVLNEICNRIILLFKKVKSLFDKNRIIE
ncbi:hypothetical protein HYV11_01420 [Candidatus Dependentiae bacterium]|nr:hypothetical protein [Candidatus Dependentiae bacterium]